MGKFNELTGRRFTRLVAVKRIGVRNRKALWVCQCDCGNETTVTSGDLGSGHTRSCGCINRQAAGAVNLQHGKSKLPMYKAWIVMRQRCENPQVKCYPHYGGRGIRVCERWQVFENFLTDMGERPDGMTLDRINVDGNYEPSNCRWADAKTQASNRRPMTKAVVR